LVTEVGRIYFVCVWVVLLTVIYDLPMFSFRKEKLLLLIFIF